ncbi:MULTISPECIES: DMT family transporter [Acinetobacter calcoaceticus/baumannii complex]|uniref:DMT family transporter n=1 Tax=Acinetobacter calcoaceticus/baumannii complex TaxID=909768 RepID=UPI0004467108|nr:MULTISPECIES: EamA family transporter [Acinetobacter calcoaceticus/baumannii complex]EXE61313.1 eamA-like transporter family protein [Acinetobacter sp. 1542444]KIE86884.1 membrane protein [Acinetobacter pittii]MBN6537958.1 EamA family transporter [Acinetobacter pittii]MCU4331813.1 EamA family transporter [Acinetobacter pittii]MDX8163138.1 EamA family transporter [Acinetobacter pittii]
MPSQTNLALTYALLVFIWATTPLAIVWSVSDLHLMWALLLRFFIALPLAVIILLILRTPFPTHRQAVHSYIAGSFSLIGSQIFTYAATQYLSSGMIALMFGLAPIMAGLIGRFAFGQQLYKLQWLGMAIAVSGLAIICLSGANQHVHPFGIILMLISVFVYSFSIFWVKKVNAQIQPMAQATGSILVSSIFASCFIPFIWQYAPTHLPEAKSLFALIYTVLMASLVAMFCYFKLIQNIQATTLSLTTVITPMLAMMIGAALNHEQLSIMVFVGAFIILSGLFLYFYKDIQANRNFAQHMKSK